MVDDTSRVRIERACEALVVNYTHYVDFGEAARVAELFTHDGVWESGETSMVGAEQIRRGFESRQKMTGRTSRHACTNLHVDVIDERNAQGLVYFTLYRHDGDATPAPLDGPLMVGQYRDRFVLTDDGWRFTHRTAEAAFVRKSSG